MGIDQPQGAYARAAASRRAATLFRLSATLMIAVLLHLYIRMEWVWVWAGLYTLAQGVELWVGRPIILQPQRTPPRWRRWAMACSPVLTSTIFGSLSIPLFASHERFAPTLGAMLLAGSLLNVIAVNASLRLATLSAAAPHLLYLLIVPFIARMANPDAPLANALWFGALLLVGSVAVANRTLTMALSAEAAAKD
jgi:hypothetical protein